MFENIKTVLIIAPHADDGEFGCGGTIARFIREGKEVYYAVFSLSDKSTFEGLPKDTHEKELKAAVGALGLKNDNLIISNYGVRDFPAHRQEILEDMIGLKKKINPDLVLIPSANDAHQDHETISQEGFRAFKKTNLWGYELPWNNRVFAAQGFVVLTQADIAVKIKAVDCYQSQKRRMYASGDFIKSLALVRGANIDVPLAEAFEIIRLIAI